MPITKWINIYGGNWNDAGNWDNGVPTSAVDAVIDSASFVADGATIIINANANCASFNCSAADQSFSLISTSSYYLRCYGSFTANNKLTLTFSSTAYYYQKGSGTIIQSGATLNFNRFYIDQAGILVTNGDDFNIGIANIYHVNGTWNQNGKTISTTATYSTASGTKTLTQNGSTFNVGRWNNQYPTGFTFNSAGGTVNITGISNLSGQTTFYNLTITGNPLITSQIQITSNITVSNVFTVLGYNATAFRLLISSSVLNIKRTITCNGTINASNVDFRDITGAGSASWDLSLINGCSGDCGGNSGISFSTPQSNWYHNTEGASNWHDSGNWFLGEGGTGGSGRVPLPQDTKVQFSDGCFNQNHEIIIAVTRLPGFDYSAVGAYQVLITILNLIEVYGDLIFGNQITPNVAHDIAMFGSGDIKTFNKIIESISFKNRTGAYTFKSDFSMRGYLNHTFTGCSEGVLDFNDKNLSIRGFLANMSSPTYTIYLGDGTIRINETEETTAWSCYESTNLICENSKIVFYPVSGFYNISFYGGSKVYNVIQLSGSHNGFFFIIDNNEFSELIIDAGRKLCLIDYETQHIYKLTAIGTPSSPIEITTQNQVYNCWINYLGTKTNCDYLILSYLEIIQDNLLYAGLHSTDGGYNSGWIFGAFLPVQGVNLIEKEIMEADAIYEKMISDVGFEETEQLNDLRNFEKISGGSEITKEVSGNSMITMQISGNSNIM